MRFYDNLLGHNLDNHLNSRGHRCKDIENINLHNYILFVGDNVALDFNSPIEDTYPYLISKQLGIDYYNLSIFNGGIDAVKYNTLTWYYKYPKPKAIVISTEFVHSLVTAAINSQNLKVADYNDPDIQQVMTYGEHVGFFTARRLLAQNLLLTHLITPVYQIVFKDKAPLFEHGVINIEHQGDMFDHKQITSEFVKRFLNQSRRMLP
jgi:hypothetical protein